MRPPKVIGESDCRVLGRRARAFYVACFSNARIQAGSAIVDAGGNFLLDFEGTELQDVDEQLELDPRIFCATRLAAQAIEGDCTHFLELDEAFGSLVGPHTAAFGHWLEEYLPKYIAAVSAGALPRVPLLIDADMPANHREILEFMLSRNEEIIELEPRTLATVHRLWWAPALMQYGFLVRPHVEEDFFVTPPARFEPVIAEMRRRANVMAPTGVERLFLSRNSELRRQLVNSDAIEALAVSRGFTMFCPEDNSFADQARFVAHARYIAGAEGSSMFLNFFAQSGTKLCILNHPVTAQVIRYTAVLEAAGIDVTVLTGRIVRPNLFPGYPNFGFKHFADYEIDEARFSVFLDQWLTSA